MYIWWYYVDRFIIDKKDISNCINYEWNQLNMKLVVIGVREDNSSGGVIWGKIEVVWAIWVRILLD